MPGQYRNVIPNFIFLGHEGQPLPITGDGEMTRDFTFVEDIVDALLSAGISDKAIGEEMNIASGRETKILDLANMINELVENDAGIVFTDRRKWDTKSRLRASVEKAGEILDYDPKTDFLEGLKQTISWFKDNWQDISRDAEFPPGMSSAVKNYVLSHHGKSK